MSDKAAIDCGGCRVGFIDGNIVNHEADGLVCSGNVWLNMSGGVNGELLHQGGTDMQRQLHDWLKAQPKAYVQPGFAMRIGPEPFAFRSIVYTVAVDAFYGSSPALVKLCLANAFAMLAEDGCKSVAVTALATAYGPMSRQKFGSVLKAFLDEHGNFGYSRIDVVCERGVDEVAEGFGDTGWRCF